MIEIRENNLFKLYDDKDVFDWCKNTSVALSKVPLEHMLFYINLSIFSEMI